MKAKNKQSPYETIPVADSPSDGASAEHEANEKDRPGHSAESAVTSSPMIMRNMNGILELYGVGKDDKMFK